MKRQRINGPKKFLSIVLDPITYDRLCREAEKRQVSKALIIGETLKERYAANQNFS